MLQHGLERPRVAAAQKPEKPRRDLEAGNVADAADVEQRPLERGQAAPGVVGLGLGRSTSTTAARQCSVSK